MPLPQAIRPLNTPSTPKPPKAVANARAKLEQLLERLSLVDEQVSHAEAAITDAKRADVRAIADAAHAGKSVDDPHHHERAAIAAVEQARAPREGVMLAIREATGRLIDAIKASHDEWRDEIDSELTDAHAELLTAVDQAQAAARRLAAARGADRWIAQFAPDYLEDADQRARRDWPTSYVGADKLTVDARLPANQDRTVLELLAAARSITAKPAPPRAPRTLMGETSRGWQSSLAGDPRPQKAA